MVTSPLSITILVITVIYHSGYIPVHVKNLSNILSQFQCHSFDVYKQYQSSSPIKSMTEGQFINIQLRNRQ